MVKKVTVSIIISILVLVVVGRIWWHANEGFLEGRIQQDPDKHLFWKIKESSPETLSQVQQILSQPFFYLAKGHQSYVFMAQDGRHVIKFVKFSRYLPNPIVKAINLPASRLEKIDKNYDKLNKLLNSWLISYNLMQEDSALVYMHLNPNQDNIEGHLIAFDKLGVRHEIDLAQTVFLIQNTVDVLGPSLEKMMGAGKLDKAKEVLSNLFAMYAKEMREGIWEKDRYMLRNMGIIGTRPIRVDVGQLEHVEPISDEGLLAKKIAYKTEYLSLWLEQQYPELFTHWNNLRP